MKFNPPGIVGYHYQGKSPPLTGIILQSHEATETLDLVYFSNDTGLRRATGVKHKDDPWFKKYPDSVAQNGYFTEAPTSTKSAVDTVLLARLIRLEDRLLELEEILLKKPLPDPRPKKVKPQPETVSS